MARITVNVTQRDIDRGWRQNTQHCPIALALHRHKQTREAAVHSRSVLLPQHKWFSEGILLPTEAQSFIYYFDHHSQYATPFTFTLEVPD